MLTCFALVLSRTWYDLGLEVFAVAISVVGK